MSTPFSRRTYTGDAATKDFAVSFPYLKRAHVKVLVDDTLQVDGTDYNWTSDTNVQFVAAPADKAEVLVKRETPESDQIVQWDNGSYIIAEDLNESDLQWLYLIQEHHDDIYVLQNDVLPGVENFISDAQATKDPTDPVWDGDKHLASAGAIDRVYSQIVGDGSGFPGAGNKGKHGLLRVDDTGSTPKMFYWDATASTPAWVEVQVKGDKGDAATITVKSTKTTAPGTDAKVTNAGTTAAVELEFEIPRGDKGETGPAPGLQSPPATATTLPPVGDTTLATATATVTQDSTTKNLQFQFGVPAGIPGQKGEAGAGVTYLGKIDATTAAEPTSPSGGDFYVNTKEGTSSWAGAVKVNTRIIYNAQTSSWDTFAPVPYESYWDRDTTAKVLSPVNGADAVDVNGNIRLTSTGRIGVGTTTPGYPLDVKSSGPAKHFINGQNSDGNNIFQVYESSVGDGKNGLLYLYNSAGDNEVKLNTNGPSWFTAGQFLVGTNASSANAIAVFLGRTNALGTTGGEIKLAHPSASVPTSGTLGNIQFGNTSDVRGAEIYARASSTWATDSYPTYLAFSTTADGAASPTERVRIDSKGHVGVGGNGTNGKFYIAGKNSKSILDQTLYMDAGDSFPVQIALANGYGAKQGITFLNNGSSSYTSFGIISENTGLSFKTAAYNIGNDSDLATGWTERMRIDGSGRLLVGTSSTSGSGNSRLQVAKQTMTTSEMGLASFQLVSASSRYPQVFLEKSRGDKVGDKDLVRDQDFLGALEFRGSDGTKYLTGASITAQINGTPAENDLPTDLQFRTTPASGASPIERMRIDPSGNVKIIGTGSAAAPKIALNKDGTGKFVQYIEVGNASDALYGIVAYANSGDSGAQASVSARNDDVGGLVWRGRSDSSTTTSKIGSDGSAEFASVVKAGDTVQATAKVNCFVGRNANDSNKLTCQIAADGTSVFKNNMTVDQSGVGVVKFSGDNSVGVSIYPGAIDGDPRTIELKWDGTAYFKGDIDAPNTNAFRQTFENLRANINDADDFASLRASMLVALDQWSPMNTATYTP